MHRQLSIKIIDLEHDHLTVGFERPEVVFFVRVVGVTEIVKDRDGLDDPFDGFGAKRRHAKGDDSGATAEMLTQSSSAAMRAVFVAMKDLQIVRMGSQRCPFGGQGPGLLSQPGRFHRRSFH